MRKIVVLTFISLDGVMQAPGGPDEDTDSDFKFGGWQAPFSDEESGQLISQQMSEPFDLLLGRKTYDIFASYWPNHIDMPVVGPAFDKATKYVVSHQEFDPSWEKTVLISGDDIAEKIRAHRAENGPMLQVYGSSELVQTLLTEDLVDELWLKTYPITLGTGKKLFSSGTIPVSWEMIESHVTPNGIIFANYRRAGEIETGTVGQ